MKLRKQNKSKTVIDKRKSSSGSTEHSRKYWERICSSKYRLATHK